MEDIKKIIKVFLMTTGVAFGLIIFILVSSTLFAGLLSLCTDDENIIIFYTVLWFIAIIIGITGTIMWWFDNKL